MKGKVTRIFLESTCSLDTNFTTGIQRVVRSVISEAEDLSQRIGVDCIPVVFRKDRFYDARTAWQQQNQSRDRGIKSILRYFMREIEQLSPITTQLYSSALVRMRKALYPKTLARSINNVRWQLGAEPVSFCDTDILLLLDETWKLPIWPAIEHARAKGCSVGTVIYDLIPIDHPQFFQSNFVILFAEGFSSLLQHSDFFLPISGTVAGRLKARMVMELPQEQYCKKSVMTFRLGAATADATATQNPIRSPLRRLFEVKSEDAPYLCVGTLEPRKNHQYLLDAFELVWQRNPQVKLCIVGRIGWKCNEILERIKHHPQFGKSLFLFTNLDDTELFSCYRHTKAVVSCSLDEGFGLPVVEGLQQGSRVLASDIPIHREIGRDYCSYFDVTDPQSLAKLILDMERRGASSWEHRPEEPDVMTWRESSEDLITKTLNLAEITKIKRSQVMERS